MARAFRACPSSTGSRTSCAAASSRAPTRSSPSGCKPPYNLDGWRIDVANMTGRYLDEDLNAEVRRIIRKTMIEINPDTILLGESTNDASSDFQGDAWHGAMTYANFTRPLWGWLSKRRAASRGSSAFPTAPSRPTRGVEFFEAHRKFAAGFPWRVRLHNMNALDTHDTAALPHARPRGRRAGGGRACRSRCPASRSIFAGDEFGLVGDDGEHSRTPMPWDALAEGQRWPPRPLRCTRSSSRCDAGMWRSTRAASAGCTSAMTCSSTCARRAEESVLVLAARDDFDVTLAAPMRWPGSTAALRLGVEPSTGLRASRHRAGVRRVASARHRNAPVLGSTGAHGRAALTCVYGFGARVSHRSRRDDSVRRADGRVSRPID